MVPRPEGGRVVVVVVVVVVIAAARVAPRVTASPRARFRVVRARTCRRSRERATSPMDARGRRRL
jgi:type II secretory pathway pseudopilin PulG